MTHDTSWGPVHGPPVGEITRRSFMRRVLGVGVGILSLEFLGGTVAFLWPNLSEGLGAMITIGTAEQINNAQPEWQNGLPYIYGPANLFIVNVPAAKARVEGNGQVAQPVPDPGTNLAPDLPLAERSVRGVLAQVPAPRLPDPAALRPEPVVRVPLPRQQVHGARGEA